MTGRQQEALMAEELRRETDCTVTDGKVIGEKVEDIHFVLIFAQG